MPKGEEGIRKYLTRSSTKGSEGENTVLSSSTPNKNRKLTPSKIPKVSKTPKAAKTPRTPKGKAYSPRQVVPARSTGRKLNENDEEQLENPVKVNKTLKDFFSVVTDNKGNTSGEPIGSPPRSSTHSASFYSAISPINGSLEFEPTSELLSQSVNTVSTTVDFENTVSWKDNSRMNKPEELKQQSPKIHTAVSTSGVCSVESVKGASSNSSKHQMEGESFPASADCNDRLMGGVLTTTSNETETEVTNPLRKKPIKEKLCKEEHPLVMEINNMGAVSNEQVMSMFSQLLSSINESKTELSREIQQLRTEKDANIQDMERKQLAQEVKLVKLENENLLCKRQIGQLNDALAFQNQVMLELRQKVDNIQKDQLRPNLIVHGILEESKENCLAKAKSFSLTL